MEDLAVAHGLPFRRMLAGLPEGALCAFLGDSITEQNLFTLYVELYLRSRWQSQRFRFVNVGWGGHCAGDGLGRVDRDVLARGPSVVFVAFGMNDGGYRRDPALPRQYERDMEALVRRLRGAGAEVVVLSPTPVDEERAPHLGPIHYNDTLERLGTIAGQVAARHGAYAVDLFHPVLRAHRLAKSARPGFTFVSDGVHPDPLGHLVMAYELLVGLGLVTPAASATVDAACGQALVTQGCRIDALQADGASARMTLVADAPPFPVPPEARGAGALVPWEEDLGHNKLQVVGLAPGRYAVYSGPDPLGTFSDAELRAGVAIGARPAVRTRWEAALDLARRHFADHLFAWRRLEPWAGEAGSPELREAYRALDAAQQDVLRALLLPLPLPLEIVPGVQLALGEWEVAGPYPLDGQDGFSAVFPPERGEMAPWARARSPRPADGFLDFVALYGPLTQAVAYARFHVFVPEDARLRLRVGSDDGWKLCLNGELRGGRDIYRGAEPDQDRIDVALTAGWNEVLLRVNNGAGAWQLFCAATVTDLPTRRVEEVRVQAGAPEAAGPAPS